LLRAENDFTKAFTNFSIQRLEIERRYTELLKQSMSPEETAALQQARSAEYKQSSLTLQQRINELLKQSQAPLNDAVESIKNQVAFEREYGELIKNGTNPEVAKQILAIRKAYNESVKLLEPALAAAQAAVTKAKAEGASATEIQKYREELERIEAIRKGLAGKKTEGEAAAVELNNGSVFIKRFRASDHPQVSQTSFRNYDIDVRVTQKAKERESSFDKRLIAAAENQLIESAAFAWQDQMNILRPFKDPVFAEKQKTIRESQNIKDQARLKSDEVSRFFKDTKALPKKRYINSFGMVFEDNVLNDSNGVELGKFDNLDQARFWARDIWLPESSKRFQSVTPEQFNNKLEELQTLDLEDDQFVMPKFNSAKDSFVDTIVTGEAHLMVRGRDEVKPYGAHELFIVDNDDNPIGFVRLTKSPEQISINMIQIDEDYRGRGIGSEFYRYWLDKGVSIKSDKEITEGTAAIYQKLAREGYRMDIQDNRAVLLPKSNDIRFQPDPASPNILNGSDGSRIIKSNSGKYRVYLATGALAGVKDTLESAKKLNERKSK
jgi:GNAT superfamily N-acetyltransferase